jgi:hypothetical protein
MHAATGSPRGRRGDDRWILAFEPLKRMSLGIPERSAEAGTGDERLEEARGRRRPVTLAVEAPIVKADE